METITIPKSEYLELIDLYKQITEKMKSFQMYDIITSEKHFDAYKYCGTIKLKEDPLEIQKRMRNEWE